jgi:hypothetical protein
VPLLIKPEIYAKAYKNGVRLRGIDGPLDKNLRVMDEADPYFLALGSADYVIGFSDGWHGIAPLAVE